jgi:hypothetical protein
MTAIKACKDLPTAAVIAVNLARSSILCVEDLWSSKKIQFIVQPEPQTISRGVVEEIILRSVEAYLRRPGHVLLPDNMVSDAEFIKQRDNSLLRVRRLWEYWHGSATLNYRSKRTVSTVPNTYLIDENLTTNCFRSTSTSRSSNTLNMVTQQSPYPSW